MIRVLFFASLREALQTHQLDISPEPINTIKDIMSQLKQRGDVWSDTFEQQQILISLNQNIVKSDASVEDEDEVAFFPPITGG